MRRYQKLRDSGGLTARVVLSQVFPTVGSLEAILAGIDEVARNPLRQDDGWLHLIRTKAWLDGGMSRAAPTC